MKLEVGMYVRIETGQIGKITNFDGSMARVDTDKFITYKDFNSEITKASHNIIDLIQVGDYVNGYKVSAIYNPNGDEIVNITLIMEYGYETINTYIDDYSINSIVTKEQFESMSYKVEG